MLPWWKLRSSSSKCTTPPRWRKKCARPVFKDFGIGLGARPFEDRGARWHHALFRDGKLGLLVATTVIEVGIDIPNATVMVVEHAERFGLSQLHQLRGRVGRGTAPGHCLLVNRGTGGALAAERLRVMDARTQRLQDCRSRSALARSGRNAWHAPVRPRRLSLCQFSARRPTVGRGAAKRLRGWQKILRLNSKASSGMKADSAPPLGHDAYSWVGSDE